MMFDFVLFARDYNIKVTTHSKSVSKGWVGVRCPFCIPRDTGHHLGFHLRTGHFSCWKCGYHSAYEVIKSYLGYVPDMGELFHKYEKIGIRGHNARTFVPAEEVGLPTAKLTKAEKNYLTSRDFDPDYAAEYYDVRSGGLFGYWKYRIVFPVYQNGRIVSAFGRAIVKDMEPRYKALPDFKCVVPLKATLFGLDQLISGRKVIVVEGPMDQMRIGNASIALYGTGVDPFQKEMISRLFDEVFILFDSSETATKEAEKLASDLCALGVSNVEVITGFASKDPGEFTEEEVRQVRGLIS